jgi:hypothetical protein
MKFFMVNLLVDKKINLPCGRFFDQKWTFVRALIPYREELIVSDQELYRSGWPGSPTGRLTVAGQHRTSFEAIAPSGTGFTREGLFLSDIPIRGDIAALNLFSL